MSDSPAHAPSPAKPKSFLLTSCVSPLGHAISLHLLAAGASLAACCTRRDLDSAYIPALRAAAAGAPERLVILELDAQSAATCQAAMASAAATFGRVDVVVHAGVATHVGALEELGAAGVAAQFETGFFGRVNVVRAALGVAIVTACA